MAISFNQVPTRIRVPIVTTEFDNSAAIDAVSLGYRGLLIGQAEKNTGSLKRLFSAAQAEELFGNSQLAAMASAWYGANKLTELWAIGLPKAGGSVKAEGSIALTGTATEAGQLAFYIAGRRVTIAVASGATNSAVATALAAAINKDKSIPATATASSGTVTLTARWDGTSGNSIDLRQNYYSTDADVAGLTVALTAFSGGTGSLAYSDAVALFADVQYNVVVCESSVKSEITSVLTELQNRFGPTEQIDGIVYAAAKGTQGELTTLGESYNNQFITLLGAGKSPTPTWQWAAVYGAVAAQNLENDPARPLQSLRLPGVLPPTPGDQFSFTERNGLLYSGVATHRISPSEEVFLENTITTYRQNDQGADDSSYLNVEPISTLSAIRRDWNGYIQRKYPRHKLGDDSKRYGAGQAIMTPGLYKSELIARARHWEEIGWVENVDAFSANITVERNATNRDRLDAVFSPDLINQFRVAGNKIQFIL